MVTDGTSNTLMASEGYIGHAQMRSCGSAAGSSPSDPITGTYSFTNVPLPGRIRLRRWPIRSTIAHGDRQGESRRTDRPYPLG